MKDYKNDSTDTLTRFGRDKRTRIVKVETERVQRTPRLHRESEHTIDQQQPARRRSFNPNFTNDNRLMRNSENRDSYPTRFSANRDNRDTRENRDSRGTDRPARSFESRSSFDRKDRATGIENRGRYKSEYKPESKFASRFNHDRNEKSKDAKKRYAKSAESGGKRPKPYPKYRPDMPSGEIRLNRFIAQSGMCSRREADSFIAAGVVTVNGHVITELGTKILPTDDVRFNNEPIHGEHNVYLVLNKPKGYVTTLDDPHASKIVTDLVRNACKERIYPVGRLDKNSVGLLLFTNDGDLTKQLTHPSYQKKKIYQVTLDKPITDEHMDRIANGITLEDGEVYADEIACIKDNKREVGIEIHSGRNRIVRRIFEHLGYEVEKLDRVYYAGLTKKNLKRGAWRFLTKEEVTRLKTGMYD